MFQTCEQKQLAKEKMFCSGSDGSHERSFNVVFSPHLLGWFLTLTLYYLFFTSLYIIGTHRFHGKKTSGHLVVLCQDMPLPWQLAMVRGVAGSEVTVKMPGGKARRSAGATRHTEVVLKTDGSNHQIGFRINLEFWRCHWTSQKIPHIPEVCWWFGLFSHVTYHLLGWFYFFWGDWSTSNIRIQRFTGTSKLQ